MHGAVWAVAVFCAVVFGGRIFCEEFFWCRWYTSGVAGTLLALLVHFGAFSGAGSSLVECMVQSGQWLYCVQ